MGLTFYIGGSSIVLRIQRVELLIEPVLGGDPGVDGAADRLDQGGFITESPCPIDLPCPSNQRSGDRSIGYP
jgi:hypothetical protein